MMKFLNFYDRRGDEIGKEEPSDDDDNARSDGGGIPGVAPHQNVIHGTDGPDLNVGESQPNHNEDTELQLLEPDTTRTDKAADKTSTTTTKNPQTWRTYSPSQRGGRRRRRSRRSCTIHPLL
jgi:hypothetical protein